ncbi:DUF1080 domain-containing protein [Sediminicola luteus]|uniref:3-keto-alpha-glucoside-1,2-lyase/3-keto-2-hydroxy-glucal hydratase domain-containing protein n=1 Tax=Sediminicola luteus TaxID=319238 RepID=A0A2A4G821_9FLAO|nr:DUF1080 domain-containing protein [Sediminicola luteus]PCE64767.1 hypothetical protein B7P33_06235 [Sediminicola luteus]
MKNILKQLFLVGFLSIGFGLNAQINRTLDTKVADILAQFPVSDAKHNDQLMEDMLSLNTAGLQKFTQMLVPAGTGDDAAVRYALNSLATYVSKVDSPSRELVEQAILQALNTVQDQEIQSYLLGRLAFCGTDRSVTALTPFANHPKLYKDALATLQSIGTEAAAAEILKAAENSPTETATYSAALGALKYNKALPFISKEANSKLSTHRKEALAALAQIASPDSYALLSEKAQQANYLGSNDNATITLLHYGYNLNKKGTKSLASTVGHELLENCTQPEQLHFRSAALAILAESEGADFGRTLLKEIKNPDQAYRGAVLGIAQQEQFKNLETKWIKAYKKADDATKAQLLAFLADSQNPKAQALLLKGFESKSDNVRVAAAKAMAYQPKAKAVSQLLDQLEKPQSDQVLTSIQESLARTASQKEGGLLLAKLNTVPEHNKSAIIKTLGQKEVAASFDALVALTSSPDESVRDAAYDAIASVAAADDIDSLLAVLDSAATDKQAQQTQKAITGLIATSEASLDANILTGYRASKKPERYYPLFSALGSPEALAALEKAVKTTHSSQALEALGKWQGSEALPILLEAAKAQTTHDTAFYGYLNQVDKSGLPADQRLLLAKKAMPLAKSGREKMRVLKSVERTKTFLALVYAGEFLEDSEINKAAAGAVVHIALPQPGKENGHQGTVARELLEKSSALLTGPDSQYVKIDIREYLENMSNEQGFVSIFNGKDLSGWEGLVKNPIARSKMSKRQLAREQEKANAQMMRDWFVKDGIIGFKGEGYNNICTIKDYGDFEMFVDWKITHGGDSGIYLRGTPQVQIWDIARTDVGAQVGSGGLYNNQKNERIPLTVADNPVNEWNTFYIKMVGERVTVYLNGVLVTDNIALENYWDRKLPIFTKEAIELQAHGEDLGFRNVYVREIPSGEELLTEAERKDGFTALFNGSDLSHWIGNKTDYYAENGVIHVNPKRGGHGNLFSAEEYDNFVFRFDFKLTPGANNGLGIHAPLRGDAAYVAKELQILDNTAAIYANLKPYQYHGSVYGIIPAKRGHLNPVGEWNSQEVIVNDDTIKITLNGTVIVDGNIKEATKNGTLDGKDHPGLQRHNGHIGFLGHGSELWLRNIRVKRIK